MHMEKDSYQGNRFHGESVFSFVFGWRGYQLLNFTCARNNAMQCTHKVETKRDVIVSQFSYCTALCSWT